MARLRLDVNSRIYTFDADSDAPFLHAVRNDLELNNLRCLWARAVRRSHGARRWAARALLHYAGFGNRSCQTGDATTSARQRIHTLSRRPQGAGAAMQRLMHQWPDHDSRDGRFSRSQPAVIFLIIAGAIFMVAIFDSRIEARADPITIDDKITLPRSTNSFYGFCKYNADWCEGYLTGIGDILLAMGNSHILGGICNAEYDSAMLRRVFELWVENHPEKRQDDIAISAQAAFREMWPCP